MRIHVTIFSYQREEMLDNILREVNAFQDASVHELSYIILDDGSGFTIRDKNAVQFEHVGKPGFCLIWDYALKALIGVKADIFLFIPSDFADVDFERIVAYSKRYGRMAHNHGSRPYVYNLVNDGRTNCWNVFRPQHVDQDTMCVGFTDCGFFCNGVTLDRLGRHVKKVNPERFTNNAQISSGVGQQLTQRLTAAKVPMYLPYKSLCFHGDHPSTMHPDQRLINPLISK